MRVYLSLGSNLGDRAAILRAALSALAEVRHVQLAAVSDCYETEPVGKTDQPAFLNLAAAIETDLEPLELLDAVKDIERGLGRAPGERWGPRAIDIDLVLWGMRTIESETLTLPHAEFRKRAFVLTPLAEIAPQEIDPATGKTVSELAASPEAEGRVARWGHIDH